MTGSGQRQTRDLAADLGWGVRSGVLFGLAYCVLAVLIIALRLDRAQILADAPQLARILPVYVVAGLVGGITVGLLRPFTRRRGGAILVGVLAATPAMLCFGLALFGSPAQWEEADWFALIICSVLFGAYGGYTSSTPRRPSSAAAEHRVRLRTVRPSERGAPEA